MTITSFWMIKISILEGDSNYLFLSLGQELLLLLKRSYFKHFNNASYGTILQKILVLNNSFTRRVGYLIKIGNFCWRVFELGKPSLLKFNIPRERAK